MRKHCIKKHADRRGQDPQQTQFRPPNSANGGTSSDLFAYNSRVSRNEVVDYICTESLAFQMAESLDLEHCVQSAWQPSFKKIPRTTFKRDLVDAFKRRRQEVVRLLDDITQDVNLCADIWSDRSNTTSYMGISCHWIDNDWNMQKGLIAYPAFNESHTAQNICRLISKVLDEYGLRKRIFSISFDNASNNDRSIVELKEACQPFLGGSFFHIRCLCHVLNLCVTDKMEVLNSSFGNTKNACQYINARHSLERRWNQWCTSCGSRPYRLPTTTKNCWNTMYDLWAKTNRYKDLLVGFVEEHYGSDVTLYVSHWTECEKVMNILEHFKQAITELYGLYDIRYGVRGSRRPTYTVTSSTNIGGGKVSTLRKVMDKISAKRPRPDADSLSSCEEIDKYLSTTFEIEMSGEYDFYWDILGWLRSHSRDYPVLSQMEIGFLSCPVSTVTVERAFSIGGNMLGTRRTSMHPRSLEQQMCLNDWVLAERRQQFFIPPEEDDQDFVDTDGIMSGTNSSVRGSEDDDNAANIQ